MNKYLKITEVDDISADDIPDEISLDNDLKLITRNDNNIIMLSEIYSGNLSGSSKIKASILFEDKAGDEEGVTEGKVHIGDYINYNPIYRGDTGTEAKYSYQSPNEYTGITEAIEDSTVSGFTYSSQNFKAASNLKWQVIGKEENNILITTETPIVPENPVTIYGWTGYGLYGAKAYVNINPNSEERNEIKNISRIYGNGNGADSNKTRGMTIEDVNKVTGVTANGITLSPSGIYTSPTGYEYGKTLTNHLKGTSVGWTPEAWLAASTTERQNDESTPGFSGKITGYNYQGSNESLKTATSAIRNKLIFGESNSYKAYWLDSLWVYPQSYMTTFGSSVVFSGKAGSDIQFFYSSGGLSGLAIGVCPIVYLDSNVTLTPVGTINNITTWNID